MAEVVRRVIAESDDVTRELSRDRWGIDSGYEIVGHRSALSYKHGNGLRFTNITIPQGATIDNGTHLTLKAIAGRAEVTVKCRISAEDIDDAPTFADDADIFDTRYGNHTTAIVDWDNLEEWVAETEYDSPEIKAVIQEIISRPGWESGFDIVIFWEDFDDRSSPDNDVERLSYSWHTDPNKAAQLVIQYTPLVVGWTGKISGVTNPAKIMGVEVANIKSVKGVEAG